MHYRARGGGNESAESPKPPLVPSGLYYFPSQRRRLTNLRRTYPSLRRTTLFDTPAPQGLGNRTLRLPSSLLRHYIWQR